MPRHMFLHEVDLSKGAINSAYLEYIQGWLSNTRRFAEDGDIASSLCIQGAFVEFALYGKLKTAWLEVFEEFLTGADGRPKSYSEAFGKRLYKFAAQLDQTTIHAIHAKWWLDCVVNGFESVDHTLYAHYITPKIKDGWIYDHDVISTVERHRMRSELTMSLAQSLEILNAAGKIDDVLREKVLCTLDAFNQTGYMSAEYFRVLALDTLGYRYLAPANVYEAIKACIISIGFCDFSMKSKVDAYMGTAKRTARDKAIYSPMTACHVKLLSETIANSEEHSKICEHFEAYRAYLQLKPLDIPAFQMRDIDIPFGTDITPIEVLCASYLIQRK